MLFLIPGVAEEIESEQAPGTTSTSRTTGRYRVAHQALTGHVPLHPGLTGALTGPSKTAGRGLQEGAHGRNRQLVDELIHGEIMRYADDSLLMDKEQANDTDDKVDWQKKFRVHQCHRLGHERMPVESVHYG